METKTVKLYSLDYNNVKTYLAASLFILGNLALPQLFHLIPQGGITWLPIYFFTLVGAYKFGWKVGLLTAVLSPVLNLGTDNYIFPASKNFNQEGHLKRVSSSLHIYLLGNDSFFLRQFSAR